MSKYGKIREESRAFYLTVGPQHYNIQYSIYCVSYSNDCRLFIILYIQYCRKIICEGRQVKKKKRKKKVIVKNNEITSQANCLQFASCSCIFYYSYCNAVNLFQCFPTYGQNGPWQISRGPQKCYNFYGATALIFGPRLVEWFIELLLIMSP